MAESPLLPDERLLWRALAAAIDCFVVVLDRDLRLRFLNRSDVGFMAAAEHLGRPMTDFVAPDMHETVRRTLLEVLATGRAASYEVVGVNPAGQKATYAARVAAVIDDGAVVALVVTAMDAKLLHDTERTLRTEREVLQQMLRTQERERQLVSYDIHDGLAQYQAGAIMHLEACLHGVQSRQDPRLDDVVRSCAESLRLMRAAASEARRLIDGLRPPMLDELGIEEAVEWLVGQMREIVPTVEYVHPLPPRRMAPEVETTIFRIVQESLSNVRKHAGATSVRVVLEACGADDVRVVVSDDGAGFDVGAVPAGRFGLEGIRQRARLFGREAVIVSTPGRGTRVEVMLPMFPAIAAGRDSAGDTI